MARQRVVDGDVGGDLLVLRQRPHGDAAPPRKVIDGLQVPGADAMGDGADMRIVRDTAVERRFLPGFGRITHLADELDLDLDEVAAGLAPGVVGLADRINQTDRARRAEIDGDHASDAPVACRNAFQLVGVGADDRPRSVTMHDIAKDAPVVLACVTALL